MPLRGTSTRPPSFTLGMEPSRTLAHAVPTAMPSSRATSGTLYASLSSVPFIYFAPAAFSWLATRSRSAVRRFRPAMNSQTVWRLTPSALAAFFVSRCSA